MEYIKQTAVVVTIDTVTIATERAVKSSIKTAGSVPFVFQCCCVSGLRLLRKLS